LIIHTARTISMTAQEHELRQQLQSLKASIRTIVHDVNNPLGVLRMAAYYLKNGVPDREQQEHYFTVIGETVEKIAAGLTLLRDMSDEPGSDLPPSTGTATHPRDPSQ
jgi:nitrogen-specific signal transduction histidine kinase